MIGVFDSGFGGLTVLGELVRRLPQYDYLYLGDSARCPYGTRSADAVYEFTREAVEHLFAAGCPLVLLACNTASARALRTLQIKHLPRFHPDRRILGVVRPTVEALAGLAPGALPGQTSPSTIEGHVAVLGTPGTIESGSYRIELEKLAPRLRLSEQACPLWVPLVEAGELSGPGTDYFVRRYLDPLFGGPAPPSALALACTHYPLLLPAIRQVIPAGTRIVNQGEIVAERLADWLLRHPEMERRLTINGGRRYLTTDDPVWFAARGESILRPRLGEAASGLAVEKIRLHPFEGHAP
ncbi:MAG TPA: glutamate racemase [Polyangia bacterium]|nr:glutamate racemase [Polyangia bacterium]